METFNDREHKVLNFMDEVRKKREEEDQEKSFQNSTDYKLHCLDKGQDNAKGVCLDMIFSKLYKDALPLSSDYKVAHGEDLDAEIHDFIHDRCPKGMEYYVKEGQKKGSKIAGKILDGVDKVVGDHYTDKAMNIDDYTAKDMVFRMDDDTQKKIDVMNQDLSLDDITNVIHDNVKASAAAEINRAKKEKENIKNLESELANDMSVTSEAAIEEILSLKGYNNTESFQPTLFQGIMIGNLNKLQNMQESGMESEYLYEALKEFGYNDSTKENANIASPEELAFVESVKELTKLNLVKSLKLESFSLNQINEMANDYAAM